MLGYVVADGQGTADLLIREVAARLKSEGVALAGAVQYNIDHDPDLKCHMDLHVLSGDDVIRISQNLGRLSRGCRLDPEGLERAVGLVATALERHPDLLIVNKFGKQEADGRGFRPLIGEALSADVPVLTAVNDGNLAAFKDYAQGLEIRLQDNAEAVVNWCRAQVAAET